jgi:hypothetical protein
MPIVGADLAELSKLVTRLGGPDRQQLTTVLDQMNTAVQDSKDYWVSEYGDTFRRDFASYVTRTQQGLDDVLTQAARITRQNLSAIATATGEGSGQDSGSGSGTGSGSGGNLDVTRTTQEVLEGTDVAYAGYFTSQQAWYRTTEELWRSPEILHDHAWGGGTREGDPPHAPDFGADSDQEYAKLAYQFLQDAPKNGYDVKQAGSVVRVYDAATNTFGSYGADGSVKTFFKPDLAQNPNYWAAQPGTPPAAGDLAVVVDNSATTVDANASWLARAGRLAEPFGDVAGKAMTGLAVAGDIFTIADPSPHALGGATTERVMAAANLGAIAMTEGPLAAIIAANAADWIPVVGEVVLAATALYFVGDLIYENREAIGHALSWVNDEVTHVQSEVYHDVARTVSHVWDDIF